MTKERVGWAVCSIGLPALSMREAALLRSCMACSGSRELSCAPSLAVRWAARTLSPAYLAAMSSSAVGALLLKSWGRRPSTAA